MSNRRRKEVFYVVTRDGRRTSPQDFWTWQEAESAAKKMRLWLRDYNDPDRYRIEVIKTSSPETIY